MNPARRALLAMAAVVTVLVGLVPGMPKVGALVVLLLLLGVALRGDAGHTRGS